MFGHWQLHVGQLNGYHGRPHAIYFAFLYFANTAASSLPVTVIGVCMHIICVCCSHLKGAIDNIQSQHEAFLLPLLFY